MILTLLLSFYGSCQQNPGQPSETGMASFYSTAFEGRTTSSGKKFSNSEFTGAHRTLPFGTRVEVTNLSNQKSVIVTITDRGPFVKDRIIDLSQAAASELSFIEEGVVRVKLVIVKD